MSSFDFYLALGPLSLPLDEIEDALYEAGCDDALLSFFGAAPTLDFTREADSFSEAVTSAIGDVERAGLGFVVLRVGPDDMVNAAEISHRAGVSREAVRLWIQGARGAGDFPPPAARVGKSPVWSWLDVAEWLLRGARVESEVVEQARFLAAVNLYLNKRRAPALVAQLRFLEGRLGGYSP